MATFTESQSSLGSSTVLFSALSLNSTTYSSVSAFDNTSTRSPYAMVEFYLEFGSAPAANRAYTLFGVPSGDGTNYGTGSSLLTPSYLDRLCSIAVLSSNAMRRLTVIQLAPVKYNMIVFNNTDQNSSVCSVSLWPFSRTSSGS